ncbi:hypothetical protein BJ742DRAFT_767906 [Cladochytrium replicatum]|nr:hypothetical protein BJ742DRAFT_767906 [Cladochytrium replicatum]
MLSLLFFSNEDTKSSASKEMRLRSFNCVVTAALLPLLGLVDCQRTASTSANPIAIQVTSSPGRTATTSRLPSSTFSSSPIPTSASYSPFVRPEFADPELVFVGGNFSNIPVQNLTTYERCLTKNSKSFIPGEGCGPVVRPGQTVYFSVNFTYLNLAVSYVYWFAEVQLEVTCLDPGANQKISQRLGAVDFRSNETVQLVSRNFTVGYGTVSTNSLAQSNISKSCSDLSHSGLLTVFVYPEYGPRSFLTFDIPVAVDMGDREREAETFPLMTGDAYRDIYQAIALAVGAGALIILWGVGIRLWISSRTRHYDRAWQAAEAAKRRLALMDQSNTPNRASQVSLGRTVRRSEIKHKLFTPRQLSQDMIQALSQFSIGLRRLMEMYGPDVPIAKIAIEENKVSSAPPQSRIMTTGKAGLSIFQLWPPQLIPIGTVVVAKDYNGNLTKLPPAFNFTSALWMPIVLIASIFAIVGIATYRIVNGKFDDNIGVFWMVGGVGLIITLLTLQYRSPAEQKGSFEALLLPVAKFMFSYSWSVYADDIRTLARSMYDLGLYVWIDRLKLVSGSNIAAAIVDAVRKANTVVIFLSPEYLLSRNCMIELLEAVKFPVKVHIHVVKWDAAVYNAVCTLIDRFGIPPQRLTAHAIDNPASVNFLQPGLSFQNDAVTYGRGWIDLCAMLNAYANDDSDPYDFVWWIQNASTQGGIPTNAPYPSGVSAWNLNALFFHERTSPKDVRVGNVWLRHDCQKTGKRASAFPWTTILLILLPLLPVVDLGIYGNRLSEVMGAAQTCLNAIRNDNTTGHRNSVVQAFCQQFYQADVFTTVHSAFTHPPVLWMFDNYRRELKTKQACQKDYYHVANDIREHFLCINELQYYYTTKDYVKPKYTQAIFIGLFVLIYGFLSILNFTKALRLRPPDSRMRPLLATINLLKTTGTRQADDDRIDWNENLVPAVKVAVHGVGPVADNIRTFLTELGFLANPRWFDEVGRIQSTSSEWMELKDTKVGLPHMAEYVVISPDESMTTPLLQYSPVPSTRGLLISSTTQPPNPALLSRDPRSIGAFATGQPAVDSEIVQLPFAWVDVFVISDEKYLNDVFMNRHTLRMKQSVFVVADGPPNRPFLDDHNHASASIWLNSILYIRQSADQTNFAGTVMENISMRTTDALLAYGHAAFGTQ